jgi:hypothetical protein
MSPGAMHRLVPTIGIGSHGADENDNIENPVSTMLLLRMRGEMSSDYRKVW